MGNSRRLKRVLRANRFRGSPGAGGYGGVKMSEVLLEFAEPLVRGLSLPEDRKAFVAALKIAGLLWNEGVVPSRDGRKQLYARLIDVMVTPPDSGMERLFDTVIARGRRLYPELDRLITGVHVEIGDEGDCTVRVVSAV
jgi:hypothetical protein